MGMVADTMGYQDIQGTDHDTMCRWDYFNDTFAFEVKDRYNTDYPDTMLEVSKWNALVSTGKQPMYVVKDKKGISVFEASSLDSLPVVQKYCPTTTEFSNNTKVLKDVYLIPFERAHKFIPADAYLSWLLNTKGGMNGL